MPPLIAEKDEISYDYNDNMEFIDHEVQEELDNEEDKEECWCCDPQPTSSTSKNDSDVNFAGQPIQNSVNIDEDEDYGYIHNFEEWFSANTSA